MKDFRKNTPDDIVDYLEMLTLAAAVFIILYIINMCQHW